MGERERARAHERKHARAREIERERTRERENKRERERYNTTEKTYESKETCIRDLHKPKTNQPCLAFTVIQSSAIITKSLRKIQKTLQKRPKQKKKENNTKERYKLRDLENDFGFLVDTGW